MENFHSDFQEQCGAQILLPTNVLRCANGNNNNNNLTKKGEKVKTKDDVDGEEKKLWKCSCVGVVGVGNAAGFVEDKGGGQILAHKIEIDETEKNAENGAACENHYGLYDAGAYDSDEAAAIDFHSNRNSRNNSTDNLSYASDQFYAKDLIFLEDDYDDDDDDNGAEVDDISLNSDDCVYAYRGDGTDFDFPLESLAGRPTGIAGNSMDDEMDFLEMDFDPDTLSEIENGGNSIGSSALTAAAATDALLLQRDISQLDGRHSSRNSEISATQQKQQHQQQRQLFSSPIDDLSTSAAPIKVMSSQTLLGKNFGRMSLHLDQIQGSGDISTKPLGCESGFERLNGINGSSNIGIDAVSSISSSVGANHTKDLVIDYPSTSAHSLPNTLHAFGRETNEVVANKTSPIKVTGAKPKRLSTFSTSSSTSSKNSCKSRTSLRSVIGPSLYNSASFDERSVSCTEFRSAPPPLSIADDTTALANSANVLAGNQLDPNEESSCLDCLEKEFLASTIGKALEPINCPKCRRKRYTFSKMDFSNQQQHQQSLRCRSGSPSFFTDIASDCFYDFSHENWVSGGLSSLSLLSSLRTADVALPIASTVFKCDILSDGEQLRKKLSSDNETISIPLADLNEEIVISSLEQLQVGYEADLIKFYFESLRQTNLLNDGERNETTKSKEFQDLKHFLLHESKKNCNHPKLKRLIEHATQQQVDVQFKQDASKTDTAMVNVSATDILRHWTRNNDILCLQKLDNRFKIANVLGKIANLIRQTQTKRPSSMRTQIEFIAIPQYYPDGFLVLKKRT